MDFDRYFDIMFLNKILLNIKLTLFHQPTLMHNFLYSLTICLLHYYPRHVSSINMSIFRRKNCIYTASGIFTPKLSSLLFVDHKSTAI